MLNKILESIGHQPTKTTANTIFYKSPFSPSERTPSFTVFKNSRSGEWTNYKDYSTDKSGDIYNFIMQYFNINFKEAKAKIKDLISLDVGMSHTAVKTNDSLSFNQQKELNKHLEHVPSYKILKVQSLSNKALLNYLEERKLNIGFCKEYLNEIHYEINNKRYFAVAFRTAKEGYEVRNKYFKGSFGAKAVSLLKPYESQKRLKVFEGVYDFLAYLTINNFIPQSDYLILNSVSLYSKELLEPYSNIELYLDNDRAGNELTEQIQKDFRAIDKRGFYTHLKDVNEKLKELKRLEELSRLETKKRGYEVKFEIIS